MGNQSSVKHLIDMWAPPKNWGSVETLEAVELTICKIGDCLVALRGHVASGIVGGCFSRYCKGLPRSEIHFDVAWMSWAMNCGMPLRKRQ